ncbi:MAG: VCBS repeat-containing protein [Chloroflexota bacterium]
MPQPRRTAWVLITTLFAITTLVSSPRVVLGKSPVGICPADGMPTRWTDQFHPPNTIRVLRKTGPNAGKVETVDFWKYVGTVLRAEYSSGSAKPPPWMRVGAITVKQYAWYYTTFWRGGKVTITNPDGSTRYDCYDVKDTTADQIYRPEKKNAAGEWIAANVPTAANLNAMRETWHVTLRKWQADKYRSRLFLTGYRSGRQNPCGTDSTGYKIYQKSLRDCGTKKMTLEETLRLYFGPNYLVVDTRGHDVLSDTNDWRGDLGVLTPGTGAWRLYKGGGDSFTAGPSNSFGNIGTVLGQGMGNVDVVDSNGANDSKLMADLIMLVDNSGKKLLTARSIGNGLAQPISQNVPQGTAAEQLLVADFNGDLLTDAGLLSNGKLAVMRALGNGTFAEPVDWWTGPLNLSTDLAMAGDTNGDGKADLIVRNAAGVYSVAVSPASCSDRTVWGVCPTAAIGANGWGEATAWATWNPDDVKTVVGDYDRDGRDDILAVVKNGTGIKVLGLRSTGGAFVDASLMYQADGVNWAELSVQAMNINSDGMADLALLQNADGSTRVSWLRTNERNRNPATMTAMPALTDSLPWSANNRPF